MAVHHVFQLLFHERAAPHLKLRSARRWCWACSASFCGRFWNLWDVTSAHTSGTRLSPQPNHYQSIKLKVPQWSLVLNVHGQDKAGHPGRLSFGAEDHSPDYHG